jgi:hypothetical protein
LAKVPEIAFTEHKKHEQNVILVGTKIITKFKLSSRWEVKITEQFAYYSIQKKNTHSGKYLSPMGRGHMNKKR